MRGLNLKMSKAPGKSRIPHNTTAGSPRKEVLNRTTDWSLPVTIWLPIFILIAAYHINIFFLWDSIQDAGKQTVNLSEANDTNDEMTVKPLAYFDWIPSKPAKIDDPVDMSDFKDNILKTAKPKVLRFDDRDIVPLELKRTKKVKKSSVRAFIIDDLMSQEECKALMDVHDLHIEAMSSHDPFICFDDLNTLKFHLKDLGQNIRVDYSTFIPGTLCLNATFSSQLKRWGLSWSYGTGFYLKESKFSLDLSKRIEDAIGFNQENGGAFRVVSYLPNVGYKLHTDCTIDRQKGTEDRFGTVLVYLADVAIGGQTYFPELGISVKPKAGRALVFTSLTQDGRCDPSSKHAAEPVIKGHKYILQRWYYYQNFPGLDKRPPVPPIPERHPTRQAHVVCNEYNHGSCRWYDVWTYDVLTRY